MCDLESAAGKKALFESTSQDSPPLVPVSGVAHDASAGTIFFRGRNVRTKPTAPAQDIATLAEKYKRLGRASSVEDYSPDLLVSVSLSMPKATLAYIADQAERAGGLDNKR